MRKIIYLFMFCFIGCNKVEPKNFVLKNKMESLILSLGQHANDSIGFNFKDITDFQWDNLYFFSHKDTKQDFFKKLGYEWSGATNISENSQMFVFTKGYSRDKKVVSYIYFNEMSFDKKILLRSFTISRKYREFTPENALFVIQRVYMGAQFSEIHVHLPNDGKEFTPYRRKNI